MNIEQVHVAPISALFTTCGPAAISRLVMTIIVDAVKRMTRGWARTQLSEKCGEVIQPFVAHLDASPAIEMIDAVAGIRATRFRVPPCIVFRRVVQCISLPLRAAQWLIALPLAGYQLAFDASATVSSTATKGESFDPSSPTTATPTSPSSTGMFVINDKPFSEPLAGQIGVLRHTEAYTKAGTNPRSIYNCNIMYNNDFCCVP